VLSCLTRCIDWCGILEVLFFSLVLSFTSRAEVLSVVRRNAGFTHAVIEIIDDWSSYALHLVQ